MDVNYFVDMALKLGADHAVAFKTEDIVYDARTILKCMFGCGYWGKGTYLPI